MNDTIKDTNNERGTTAGPEQNAIVGADAVSHRCVFVLYARATEEEKRRIERRAARAGLSVSRYVVRSSAEDRPPPTQDERVKLQDLLYLFKRGELCLSHLVANAEAMARLGAPTSLTTELRETARVLSALARELNHRL